MNLIDKKQFLKLVLLNFDEIYSQGGSIREAEKKAAKKVLKLLNEK